MIPRQLSGGSIELRASRRKKRAARVPFGSPGVLFVLYLTGLALMGVLSAPPAFATPIDVSIDTSALSGQSGQLVFDLIDTSTASSSLTISAFTGNFTPDGSPAFIGDASGTVSGGFLLSDSPDDLFFNEVAVPVTFGTTMGFNLDFSFGTPGATEFPDGLSVFLLSSDFSASLISTGDPTGGDAILAFNVDPNGAPNLATYDATDGSVTVNATPVTSVPEPSTLALMTLGMLLLFALVRHTRPAGRLV